MRALVLAALFALPLALVGCDKPSEDECQKAVDNITKIFGNNMNQDRGAWVRNCRAKSSKGQVACMIAAKTVDDVAACEAKK